MAVVRSSSGDNAVTSCTSGFVDDVTFARNWPGKGDANRADTQSDSPEAESGAKSDVCAICIPCSMHAKHFASHRIVSYRRVSLEKMTSDI